MIDAALLQSLVWTDYRLALLFTVLMPLVLIIWAFVRKSEAIQLLLTIYWKVASLLMITVYLMIGGFSISLITGLMARVLIPISLWFWEDLNEEIREQPNNALRFSLVSWRWAVTVYNGVGAVAMALFLPCAFSKEQFSGVRCQTWLEPPLLYKAYFHADYTNGFLGFFGILGLVIYLISLGYFVFFRVGRQGRSAMN
jgi:hypothetical protein